MVDGGFLNDDIALIVSLTDRFARVNERAEIRALVLVNWCKNRNDVAIATAYIIDFGGKVQLLGGSRLIVGGF